MTDKEKLEKVKAEIERRKKLHEKSLTNPIHEGFGLQNVTKAKISELTYLHSFIDSMQKEPKKCMYSKDNYTDEDRKVLCEGCEEECKFNKKEEPVSDDLNTAAKEYANNITEKIGYRLQLRRAVCFGAKWQKKQIIKSICNHANIEQMVEKFEDKYKPEKVLDTEYYKRGIFDTIKTIKED